MFGASGPAAPAQRNARARHLAIRVFEGRDELPTMAEFDVRDVEYLRHGSQRLLARLHMPRGRPGPFPLLVECHGGGWCANDRFAEKLRHEALASHGVASLALDFRSGDDAPYPASLQDINYAVRWAKRHAAEFNSRPEFVGLSGMSSGGHLAMLAAMRPRDPRYAAIELPPGPPGCDAEVRFVVLSWPVINPLSRYRYAKRLDASENPPSWTASIIARHEAYWQTEANMTEGNPVLALERGEAVSLPDAIYFQAREDALHNYKDPASPFDGHEPYRFVADYQAAGGRITLEHVDLPPHTEHSPDMSGLGDAFATMAAFARRHAS